MIMGVARSGYRVNNQNEIMNSQNGLLNHDTVLVINFPDSKVLRVMSRSVFLALVLLSLPCIRSIVRGSSASFLNIDVDDYDSGFTNVEFLNLLFQDLGNEGLIKKGDKALLVGSGSIRPVIASLQFSTDNEIHLVVESDLERLGSIKDERFDFAFVSSSRVTKFVDHVVKVGGIVVMQLTGDISDTYEKPSNYKIQYLRRYNSTILAMRKTALANELIDSSAKRRLCQWTLEAKKAALKDLEDALLEPPRNALAKSNKFLKRIKFLPELLGISVGSYSRMVFVDVSLVKEKGGIKDWFHHNYPFSQDFEMYSLELVTEEDTGKNASSVDVLDWLKKNVKEEEYVVMKVESEVAEEMIEKQAICLVDEMFLECKNQRQDKGKKKNDKSQRSYWECMTLYGRLRDEGVAVHQWWG